MFDMTNDSLLFRDSLSHDMLPLYEAKMIHQFDHRFGTYRGQTPEQANQGKLPELTNAAHADPLESVEPKYWVDARDVVSQMSGRWDRDWFIGWRDIVSSVAVRTVIAAALPRTGVGNNLPLAFSDSPLFPLILANLNSFALDWQARQKVGGIHLNFFLLRQLPVLPPDAYHQRPDWAADSLVDWVRRYVGELVCTAWDMGQFGRAIGWEGAPFQWDSQRRATLRAELDGAFFHLYGLARDEVEHVMESFWVVRDRDEKEHGTYRTKELILEAYDAMAVATPERPFVSRLVPAPGDPAMAHPPRSGEAPGRWFPWADVERSAQRRSVPTPEGRPNRPVKRAVPAPAILFPAEPAEPQVHYPEAAPALRRAVESTTPAPATMPNPSQGTLADLARTAAASFDWMPEETVAVASVVPGRRIRHRRFGEGVIIEVRRTVKPPTVTIRFGASDDREIAIGYGLIEFEVE